MKRPRGSAAQALLLDLGGVLVGADHHRSARALAELTGRPVERVRAAIYGSGLAAAHDAGAIDPGGFRDGIRRRLGVEVGDRELDRAWSAVI